ncbi:MAG TPA: hypothetical protein VMR50_00185 [Myxococcota bacterium]|nr:hypothetical protein [Myxococcota bacterium]
MKCAIAAFVAAVCLLGAGTTQAGLAGFISVKVSGTIQVEQELPVGEKVAVTKLTNQTIFDEFAVSPDDYELVMTFTGPDVLELLPKSLGSKLPTITVMTLEDPTFILDTKSRQEKFGSGLSSPEGGGLFHELVGGTNGSLKFDKQGFPSGVSLSAVGSSQSSQSLFKLKISSHGVFVQSP